MMFGLEQKDIDLIRDTFKMFPGIKEVIIYGSRATGDYKTGSDIDLAVKGENLTDDIIFRLSSHLEEELAIPFFFDVVAYDKIKSAKLLEEIDQNGQLFYH